MLGQTEGELPSGARRSCELPMMLILQAAKHFAEDSFIQALFKPAFIQKIAFSHLHILQTVWQGSCRSPTCRSPAPLPPALALPDGNDGANAVSVAPERVYVVPVRGAVAGSSFCPNQTFPSALGLPAVRDKSRSSPAPPRPGAPCFITPSRVGEKGGSLPPALSTPHSWCSSANSLLPLCLRKAGIISFFVVWFASLCIHHISGSASDTKRCPRGLKQLSGPTLRQSILLLFLLLPLHSIAGREQERGEKATVRTLFPSVSAVMGDR